MTPVPPVPRSYLFVPGTRAERFGKALASGADRVVLDLEDAVALPDKAAARDAVARWLVQAPASALSRVVVRVNDAASPGFADDLRALRAGGCTQLMLPKSESAAQVAEVVDALPGARVLALVETARGVAQVDAVAGAAGVERLVFGTLDLALDLGIDLAEDATGLAYAAGRLVIASRVAGLPAPVAGVTPQLDDDSRLLADMAQARRLGFWAKLCIHPRQVAPVHAALRPTEEALHWARRVLEADAASPGVARLDGRMVDRPVVLQAQRTLALAAPDPEHST